MSPKREAKRKAQAKAKQDAKRRCVGKTADVAQPEHEEKEVQQMVPEQPSGSSKGILAKEQCALLTSLKYQTQSKKSSQQHKDSAQKLLDQYQAGTREQKWQILNDLKQNGLKSLNWTHSTMETTTKEEGSQSSTREGMLTSARILEINGFRSRDLLPEEAAETLEDLLQESEALYKHDRNTVKHKTNSLLDRHFYRWAEGRQELEKYNNSNAWSSAATTQSGKLNALLDKGGPQEKLQASDTFLDWTTLGTKLKKLKTTAMNALEAYEETVLFVKDHPDDKDETRFKELTAAAEQLKKLQEALRKHLAETPQVSFFWGYYCYFPMCLKLLW